MHEIKMYQDFRIFFLLINELEAKIYLTKPGDANNSDHDCTHVLKMNQTPCKKHQYRVFNLLNTLFL